MINSNLKGKRLLIQGAGRGNLGLIKTAKENGIITIVTGLKGDYPCLPLADKICYVDIKDVEGVFKVAVTNNIDGAVICCSDTGLHAVGICNDRLGLCGLSEKSAILSFNKDKMKETLIKNGVRTAPYYKVEDYEQLKTVVNLLKYPIIIKAIDLQGSRGINIVYENKGLLEAFQQVMEQTNENFCIVEKFLEGKEYGAQAFIYNNEVLFVLPHGDETVMCRTLVPIGHYFPLELSTELYEDTKIQIERAIKALGLNNCPVNIDLIEVDGKAYIIELTGRVGANCLPELVGKYFGINYYDMILNTVLGGNPIPIFNSHKKPSATIARMIKSIKSGTLLQFSIPTLPDTEIQMFLKSGDRVNTFTNCNDVIGQIIVVGSTLAECEAKIKIAEENIDLVII
ncbi:MAG: ATP-grasp domain-containing protein [Bacteroides sp.]|nr:ATP-grasp domain-containing protein [Bacteroides sp.]